MKKTKRLGLIYDPLHISTALVCKGGSLTQVHNAEEDEYVPDREITPLELTPEVFINDPNGVLENGQVELSGIMWYAIPKDVADQLGNLSYLSDEISRYLITGATEGFAVAEDGTLTVSRNVEYLDPIVLVFTASYLDIRSGNVIRLQASSTLTTTSVAVAAVLSLDKPSSFLFNPMADTGLRTIKAALLLGGKAPDTDNCSTRFGGIRS